MSHRDLHWANPQPPPPLHAHTRAHIQAQPPPRLNPRFVFHGTHQHEHCLIPRTRSLHTNFDAHVAAGSLWSPQLVKGRAIAAAYMAKNAGEPARVVDAVVDALTSAAPRARYVVNRSFEMALLAWTPQWIVDLAIAWQMR